MDEQGYRDLTGAGGKLVVFLASMMQRAAIISISEFGEMLDLYAQTVSETEPGQGRILKLWAAETRAIEV